MSAKKPTTGTVEPAGDRIEATRRAETIRNGMSGYVAAMDAIGVAYDSRDWITLGYDSWDDYCEKEFSEKRLKLNRDERERAVLAFRGAGMSTRAIGAVLGVSEGTVRNDLAGAQNYAPPASIKGADGKAYDPTKTAAGSSDTHLADAPAQKAEPFRPAGAASGPDSDPETEPGPDVTPDSPAGQPSTDGDAASTALVYGQPGSDHQDGTANPSGEGAVEGSPAQSSDASARNATDDKQDPAPDGVPGSGPALPEWLAVVDRYLDAAGELDQVLPHDVGRTAPQVVAEIRKHHDRISDWLTYAEHPDGDDK